ncbi:hypothetical protein [Streptosporangium sp. NPDC004631]
MSDPRHPMWGPAAIGITSAAAALAGGPVGLYPLTVLGVVGLVAAVAWATTLLVGSMGGRR